MALERIEGFELDQQLDAYWRAKPIASPRLEPPYNLTAAEVAVWRRITNCMLATHFAPSNSDLLTQLCRHIVQSDRITLLIESVAKSKKTFTPSVYLDLLKSQRAESAAIQRLARSMRLTQQSLFHRESAKARPITNSTAPVPWEPDPEDEEA